MGPRNDRLSMSSRIVELAIEEWPAVLAFVVLVLGHLVSALVLEQGIQPLGAPLIVAVVVFIVAELGRAVYRRSSM